MLCSNPTWGDVSLLQPVRSTVFLPLASGAGNRSIWPTDVTRTPALVRLWSPPEQTFVTPGDTKRRRALALAGRRWDTQTFTRRAAAFVPSSTTDFVYRPVHDSSRSWSFHLMHSARRHGKQAQEYPPTMRLIHEADSPTLESLDSQSAALLSVSTVRQTGHTQPTASSQQCKAERHPLGTQHPRGEGKPREDHHPRPIAIHQCLAERARF